MLARRGRLADERGQSIITIALFSMFLLAILAIVIESSFIYFQKRDLQNTADAAALAGAQSLTGLSASETPAKDAAKDYVSKNISGATVPDPVVGNNFTQIQVTVKKNAVSIFGGWLSFGSPEVTGKATARIASQNLPGKGVVPIGVEKSDWLNRTSGNMLLKDNGVSNAGLVNLLGDNGDQIRDGLKFGSGVPLQPTLNTEPGNKLGQATQNNNSGLHVRLSRALTHTRPDDNTKHCYTWADVQPPSSGVWQCSPFAATENDGVQATAVVLLPIIVEDFTGLNGNKTINVYKDGNVYMLAYFWIDGNATYVNPAGGDYTSATSPKGFIWGRFIENVPTQLEVFDPNQCKAADGCQIVDFDPDSIWKIVQLVD